MVEARGARATSKATGVAAQSSQELVRDSASGELVFAVVGYVGSGTSEIASALKARLEERSLAGGSFDVEILKARDEIKNWAKSREKPFSSSAPSDLATTIHLQNFGDEMRFEHGDHAAVAGALVERIRRTRASKIGVEYHRDQPVIPDGKRRAYILDSIRHPAEVHLLRSIYQEAFALIGVVCEESVRLERVTTKFSNAGKAAAMEFMKRDSRAPELHGQRVSEAFHLADFFVDNTASRFKPGGTTAPNPKWDVNEKLSRLIRILTHSRIVRPTVDETAMYHAHGAQMRSACLSRQVGAALVDREGNVVATGTNEVPQASGGVYGTGFNADATDHRCAFRETPYCSNTREQNAIIDELLEELPELTQGKEPAQLVEMKARLRKTRIGGLLEFSRAVHAEMDALLSAARKRVSPIGCRLFVTTFPCHYCARHIVTAGIDEVQFIEPYPKSRALALHDDSITLMPQGWASPSQIVEQNRVKDSSDDTPEPKVLFRPFTGVAPRLYRRVFFKDAELKDAVSGDMRISTPEWGSAWDLKRASYVQLEVLVASKGEG